jgi:ABC-type branched-subunit amino acid transport system permease subunit
MAIVGGVGFLGGPIIGSAVVSLIINILPVWYSLAITYFAYGIVVIIILKLRPTGILGLLKQIARKEKSRVAKG